MQQDQGIGDRCPGPGIQEDPACGKGVDHRSGGEDIADIRGDIALVAIRDGLAKLQGIGGAVLPGFVCIELDDDRLALGSDQGGLFQWWRDNHLFERILELDPFVKDQADLGWSKIRLLVRSRQFSAENRWCGILLASFRR